MLYPKISRVEVQDFLDWLCWILSWCNLNKTKINPASAPKANQYHTVVRVRARAFKIVIFHWSSKENSFLPSICGSFCLLLHLSPGTVQDEIQNRAPDTWQAINIWGRDKTAEPKPESGSSSVKLVFTGPPLTQDEISVFTVIQKQSQTIAEDSAHKIRKRAA